MQKKKPVSVAFTQRFPKIEDKLHTQFKIIPHFSKQTGVPILAQWDTGASMSAISKKLVEMLELPVVSMTKIGTANGVADTTIHIIDLQLPNGDLIPDLRVVAADMTEVMLVGMDVISRGDFAISNYKGHTILNFRIPSYAEIDFVQMANNTLVIRKDKRTNRNDPCPCGSGKKFKQCHGKNL